MRRKVSPLTASEVDKAKQKDTNYKLSDGKGLYLFVAAKGGKSWRVDYTINGKRKTLSLGKFPEISLAEARRKREEAREMVAHNIDPSEVKAAMKVSRGASACNSFEVVAREWLVKQRLKWSDVHAKTTTDRLERDVFPIFGARPISDIRAPEVLMMLRRIEAREAYETAHRVKSICGQIFRYAVATGRAERDPAADLRGALTEVNKKHLASIIDPVKVGELLRAIDGFAGSYVVQCALRLAPLVFVRPGELRQAEWSEINFDTAEWHIPAEKMKTKQPHIVPLAPQALLILRELQPLTGGGRYLFPCQRSTARAMSNNAINAALRRLGYTKDEMTGHGFRAMARTIMDEVLQFRVDFIEHQLAHTVKDPLGTAYNRTKHLEERRVMMNTWANYLDGLKQGAKVIPFRKMANS